MQYAATIGFVFLVGAVSCAAASDAEGSGGEDTQACSPGDSLLDCMCNSSIVMPFRGAVRCELRDLNNTRVDYSRAILKPFYCIWYNNSNQQLYAGACPFGRIPTDIVFNRTSKVGDVNSSSCGLGHTGRLCGACKPNHSLVINSYTFECKPNKECSSSYWILFFAQQLFPTLVFFVVVIFFNIKAIQGYINAFIFTAQMMSIQTNLISIYLGWAFALQFRNHILAKKLTDVIASLYSIWNLNVFYGVIPTYCIRNNMSILSAIALEFLSGVFPILVIFMSYVAIELHSKSFRPFVVLWKPFNKCCIRFRRRMSSKTSVIDALALFIVLSYTKFVVISCMLLAPNSMTTQSGTQAGVTYLYDGTVKYFKTDHILYASLSIAVLILFVIPLPLLLLLYPLSCFQKCLNRLKLRRNFVTAFMDALQGCYKDGSDGTQDCRYFSAFYFLLRILTNGIYSLLYTYNVAIFFIIYVFLLLTLAVLVLQRPYKKDLHNKFDAAIFIHLIFIVSLISFDRYFWQLTGGSLLIQSVLYISLCVPALAMGAYITANCARKVLKRRRKWENIEKTSCYGASMEGIIAENQKFD